MDHRKALFLEVRKLYDFAEKKKKKTDERSPPIKRKMGQLSQEGLVMARTGWDIAEGKHPKY